MDSFKMCNSCEKEYTDSLSRRFHAQPNCCEKCGPSLILVNNKREVVNCGGVFENQYLLKAIYSNLTERGFRVYYNSKTPINDGGISLGQMVVANAIIEEEER